MNAIKQAFIGHFDRNNPMIIIKKRNLLFWGVFKAIFKDDKAYFRHNC
jgi:hypothetical protein